MREYSSTHHLQYNIHFINQMYKLLVSEKNLSIKDIHCIILKSKYLLEKLDSEKVNNYLYLNIHDIKPITFDKFKKYFKYKTDQTSIENIQELKSFKTEYLNEISKYNIEYIPNDGMLKIFKKIKNILNKIDEADSSELLFDTHYCFSKLFDLFYTYYKGNNNWKVFYNILIEQYSFKSHGSNRQLNTFLNFKLNRNSSSNKYFGKEFMVIWNKSLIKNSIIFAADTNPFDSYSLFFLSIHSISLFDKQFAIEFSKTHFNDIIKTNNLMSKEFNKYLMLLPSYFLPALGQINKDLIKEMGLSDEYAKVINEKIEEI